MNTALLEAPTSCKVYTPPALAAAMVSAIAGRNAEEARWLEPCVGTGSFLSALHSRGISRNQITGLDIEARKCPSDAFAHTLRPQDFFEWATWTHDRFDRIIANPPYVRLRMYDPLFQPAIERLTSKLPDRITSEGNAWLLFLYGSLQLLREGGSCAFVLPAAWDYASYASCARAELPNQFREFEVHRSWQPLFPDVCDGAVVVVGRGFHKPNRRSFRFEYRSQEQLCAALLGKAQPQSVVRFKPSVAGTVRLGSFCTITIGAVTGDSDYFLLTEEKRQRFSIPESACLPVVSRARHLREGYMTQRKWERLREEGQRVWLFRPSERDLKNPFVESYLEEPQARGGCDRARFKVKNRDPWYITPTPGLADGFVSGMSTLGPWISLNGFKRLTASNTLYIVKFSGGMKREEKAALCLSLLTKECRANMRPRRYADGLPKWEPNDLVSILLPEPPKRTGALEVYREAIEVATKRGMKEASAIADAWLR